TPTREGTFSTIRRSRAASWAAEARGGSPGAAGGRETRRGNGLNDLVFFIDNALIAGLIIGAIYALGAIGVTLVFGILRFAHFAHGDMMTMGAFISLIIAFLLKASRFHSPLALVFIGMFPAMVLTAAIAIGLDKFFYKPLREAGARPV